MQRTLLSVLLSLILPLTSFAALEEAHLEQCDKEFKALEDNPEYTNMIGRDALVNDWAECWKRSMETVLDKRLAPLKKSDSNQFKKEMELQKSFNEAVGKSCGKDCGPGGTMKGLSYNFCRVEAYKYRAAQATQLIAKSLTLVAVAKKNRKKKNKETAAFKVFIEQLCQLPKEVWKGGPPKDCAAKATKELDELTFTDDPCNLS